MDAPPTTQVDLDVALYRYTCIQRELDYHRQVLAAAEEGLDKAAAVFADLDDDPSDEACTNIATWARRVTMASHSVMEVLAGVRLQAQLILEITQPGPPADQTN